VHARPFISSAAAIMLLAEGRTCHLSKKQIKRSPSSSFPTPLCPLPAPRRDGLTARSARACQLHPRREAHPRRACGPPLPRHVSHSRYAKKCRAPAGRQPPASSRDRGGGQGGGGGGGREEKEKEEGTRISTRGQALGKRGKMRRARGARMRLIARSTVPSRFLRSLISRSLDINHSRYFPPLSRGVSLETSRTSRRTRRDLRERLRIRTIWERDRD